ncbi:ABC transporter permease [Aminicella lysinilytica]|uniref:Spermidine/putrescine transport system permease protein n=1 Tax=Aminicella lysinilytica TaxID=433323 RepID=A0A4R6Q929_9FIRM|nr:ABC transporter permease [Aminicella lysinilytica]NLD10778.1 ABC transporter permease [Clostridiales bacterium]TDP59124.1 spermidine/putrescine transport system permease protein [Aminicella lysinilytica]
MYRKLMATPYLFWVLCGTIIPLCMIMYYGFTDRTGNFTVSNVLAIFQPVHAQALGLALLLAFVSTLICLLLAFPLALILKGSSWGRKGFIVFIFILPMWMNFLLRTMAWQVILEKGGIFNTLLTTLHLPTLDIINTPAAIVLGMVYDFLPFMVLPIYNTLMKIDDNVIEAAYDLGATKGKVLKDILLPLSVPGIASGITMVFVPSLTTFVISNILGGGKIYLIGNIIEQEFTTSANWNLGSGLSLVMMVFIVISMGAMSKLDKSGEGNFI